MRIVDEDGDRTLPLLDWTFEGGEHEQRYKLRFPDETWILRSCVMPCDAPPDELHADPMPPEPVDIGRAFEDPELGLFREYDALYKGTIPRAYNCEVRPIATATPPASLVATAAPAPAAPAKAAEPEPAPDVKALFREAVKEARDATPAMLTIRQAAEYARVDERTIRNWIDRHDGDKRMLPGAIKAGRKVSIPRTDLDPWRKAVKATRTPKKTSRKRPARKSVKRKS
jgi:excisionase family DNA binding protein